MKAKILPILISVLIPISAFADTLPAVTTTNITCDSHFPQEVKTIDTQLIEAWADQAAIKSFTFEHTTMDNQIAQLKTCFTDQGWQGFNDAMQKSGNLQAIKAHQLNVTSQVQGNVAVQLLKENEWKVTVPLNVVYANKEQKIAQLLTIELLINRKPSGDLGIVQLIATPAK